MEADYDDDFEADVVEATVPTATEVHTSAEDAPPAAGADARGLQQRLAAARAEKGALAERRKVLLSEIAAEERELKERKRRLGLAYDRLTSQLDLPPEMEDTSISSDADIMRLSEELETLQERLRTARDVLRQRTAARDALRTKLALADRHGPPPGGLSAAAGGGGGGGGGGGEGAPARPARATKPLSSAARSEMMRRLVPTAEALAARPGLHPESAKLFQQQGIKPQPLRPNPKPKPKPKPNLNLTVRLASISAIFLTEGERCGKSSSSETEPWASSKPHIE